LTPDYFATLIRDAREAFEVAARVVREVKDVGSTIIADVNNANSFWKQLRLALVTSILSPIIIGVLIFLGVTYRAYVPYWEDLQNKFQKASVISTEHTASKSN